MILLISDKHNNETDHGQYLSAYCKFTQFTQHKIAILVTKDSVMTLIFENNSQHHIMTVLSKHNTHNKCTYGKQQTQ